MRQRRWAHLVRPLVIGGIATVLGALAPSPAPARAAAFVVTRQDDVDRGGCAPGDCSLREAIRAANAAPLGGGPQHVVTIPAGEYTLTIAGRGEDFGATGDLDLRRSMRVQGAGAWQTVVRGGGLDRVFHVHAESESVTINDLVVTGGDSGPSEGGGILNLGALTMSGVVVMDNVALNGGGLAQVSGRLSVGMSTIWGNGARGRDASGGGIWIGAGTARLVNATVTGNTAARDGGGIWTKAETILDGVTIADNRADGVGEATFSLFGPVISASATILDAEPGEGAACFGAITSRYSNLDRDGSCGLHPTLDLAGRDPRLGPLKVNGGATPTRALLPGSPAIDAVNPSTPCLAGEQRGFARPFDGNGDGTSICDVGAFEVRPSIDWADVSVAIIDPVGTAWRGERVFYSVQVHNAGPAQARRVPIQFLEPYGLFELSWECGTTSGSSCEAASGVGDLNPLRVSLAAGGYATVSVQARVRTGAPDRVEARVNVGQPERSTDVTPLANEARVTTNVLASATPGLCLPRPRLDVTTRPAGPGRLEVTVGARITPETPTNAIRTIRFDAPDNSLLDLPGFGTGIRTAFVATLPSSTATYTFHVRREAAGRATTARFVALDACSQEWPSFVGGGPSAF